MSDTLTYAEKKLLRWLTDNGSTWMPLEKMPKVDFSKELKDKRLVLRKRNSLYYITFPYYEQLEKECAEQIFMRARKTIEVDDDLIDRLIDEFEIQQSEEMGFTFRFCDEQREGIHVLAASNLGILTGGPGTGKTSVLQCLAYVLKSISKKRITIQFAAPTGKAAKRITEASGYKAVTVQKYTGGFGCPINVKCPSVFIVDEFSMADLDTLWVMLKSLMPSTRILLVGDVNQLPSVGIGAILRDLIDSNIVPYARLIKTFRQDNSSVLFDNIQNSNEGCYVPLSDGPDFLNIRTEDSALEDTLKAYFEGVEKYGLEETVVLTAYRKSGTVCADTLNKIIQDKINPPSEDKPSYTAPIVRDGKKKTITFRLGDPVMQLKNTEFVANGDIGKVVAINGKQVTVRYPDSIITYKGFMFDDLDLAYAMSVHKSQGSQYKYVVMPLLRENRNLDRNLIYTGLSRAKKYCVVIGDDETVMKACKKRSSWDRCTFLCEELLDFKRVLEMRLHLLMTQSY